MEVQDFALFVLYKNPLGSHGKGVFSCRQDCLHRVFGAWCCHSSLQVGRKWLSRWQISATLIFSKLSKRYYFDNNDLLMMLGT
jgi:hypothetical protein